jgi:hypothetical protein
VGETENIQKQPIVNIYPNPSQGLFNVSITNCPGKVDMAVMNLQGQVVYTDVLSSIGVTISKQLNISGFAKGIYFIRLTSEHETWMEKVVLR